MFHLQYFDKSQLVGLFEYPTFKAAKLAVRENDVCNASTRYKITDVTTGEVKAEEDFKASEGIYEMMSSEKEIREDLEAEVDDFDDHE